MSVATQLIRIILLFTLLALSACGGKKEDASHQVATQVVAKVNGKEISIHQVNLQMGRLGPLDEKQAKAAAKKVLAQLVEQEMLKQKALEASLDRDPNVMQVIEASKGQILAQAYLEQVMAKVAKPSSSEIDAFYKEHPELFEARRVFRLQELSVTAPQEKFGEIEAGLKAVSGINQVAQWLKEHDLPFTANSNVRAAEQLPLDLLKRLQPLKDGEFVVLKTPRTVNIVHLAASQTVAIARDKAGPVIEQYFMNQNKAKLAKSEMDSLKAKAKIEYVGDFADMKTNSPEPSPKAAVEEQPTSVEPATQAPSADATSQSAAKDEASLAKGLSGL